MVKAKMAVGVMIVVLAAVGVYVVISGGQAKGQQGGAAVEKSVTQKADEAQKLALEGAVLLLEERFQEAYELSEKLITEYPGDYKIDFYLRLYSRTFCRLDPERDKYLLSEPPPATKKRIEQLISKKNKTDIDYVKLVTVEEYYIEPRTWNTRCIKYLNQLVEEFPKSKWRDWAEARLCREQAYCRIYLGEEYKSKDEDEQFDLYRRERYKAYEKYIKEHPESYMVPSLLGSLSSIADDEVQKGDATKKEVVVKLSRLILQKYPESESRCASARYYLRKYLGPECKEVQGYSEKDDDIILSYYGAPEPDYESFTIGYLEAKHKDLASRVERHKKQKASGKSDKSK